MLSLSQVETPCYVFEEQELRNNISAFANSVARFWNPGKTLVGYSVKTTPVAGLISFAKDLGCMAEVVSDEEFDLALRAGCRPDEVIFNGPIKSRQWLRYAFEKGSIVNLDSNRELRWTIEYAKETGSIPAVGLRLNFDLEASCPGESMAGDEGVRFGFCLENGTFEQAVEDLRQAGIEPAGIHAHFSTRNHAVAAFEAIAQAVCEVAKICKLDEVRYVDMGGGYYGGGARRGMYDDYAQAISSVLRGTFDPDKVMLIIEPGGSVMCTPGEYLGRVIDSKTVCDHTFIVTELSKLNLNSTVFGRRNFGCRVVETSGIGSVPKQTICGYTCMEMDRLCDLENEPPLCEGDLLAIRNAGAYTISFMPEFFIQAPPAVYLKTINGDYEPLLERNRPQPPCKP